MREFFEHTADVGLRVTAPTKAALFEEAAEGMFALVVENLDDVGSVETRSVALDADDPAHLLQDWLSELLFLFETEAIVFSRFEVALDANGLRGTAHGEPLDRSRHRLGPEVKAVTYHHLAVDEADEGFTAEVIFDI